MRVALVREAAVKLPSPHPVHSATVVHFPPFATSHALGEEKMITEKTITKRKCGPISESIVVPKAAAHFHCLLEILGDQLQLFIRHLKLEPAREERLTAIRNGKQGFIEFHLPGLPTVLKPGNATRRRLKLMSMSVAFTCPVFRRLKSTLLVGVEKLKTY
jgi:hypothetical protein